jgi:hypothetical protein
MSGTTVAIGTTRSLTSQFIKLRSDARRARGAIHADEG